MAITKFYIEGSILGDTEVISHVRKGFEGFGEERVAKWEIFEVVSSKFGKIDVYVPIGKAIVGLKYRTKIRLENPTLIPRTRVRSINGKSVSVELDVHCDEMTIIGGLN